LHKILNISNLLYLYNKCWKKHTIYSKNLIHLIKVIVQPNALSLGKFTTNTLKDVLFELKKYISSKKENENGAVATVIFRSAF